MYTKPFVLTSLAYLLFFSNVNAYNLLPLFIQALGGREGEIGTIMAMFSVAAILGQATLGGLLGAIAATPFQGRRRRSFSSRKRRPHPPRWPGSVRFVFQR